MFGSIPIGRSILFKQLRPILIFHFFQNYNLIAKLGRIMWLGLVPLEFHLNRVSLSRRVRVLELNLDLDALHPKR